MLEKLLSLLFPARCVGCRKKDLLFCKNCRKKSRRNFRDKTSLPFVDKFLSWGAYEDKILREALRRFKYHGTYGFAHPLTQLLQELIKPHLSSFSSQTLIVPIPMSKSRERERGYNQAELLAKELSEKISLPADSEILLKTRNTPSQVSLKGKERLLNIKDSFGVQNAAELKNKTILLVDDISTTGATLSEAARVLKNSGAKKVIGLVVAQG